MKYEIKTLSLGEILDQGIGLIRDKFGLLMGIMGLTVIPTQIVMGVLSLQMPQPGQPGPPQMPAPEMVFLLLGVLFLFLLVVLPLSNAAVVYAAARTYLGHSTTLGACFGHALRRLPALLWTSILMGFAIMGGLILFIIPGILCAFWFMLAQQVTVLESMNGGAALSRSKALMKGNMGTGFVLGLIIGVINIGTNMVSQLIPQPFGMVVASVVAGGMTLLSTCTFVVFYFSCRCMHDNFDLEVLANEVAGDAGDDAAEDRFETVE